jgi:hypothetical protein
LKEKAFTNFFVDAFLLKRGLYFYSKATNNKDVNFKGKTGIVYEAGGYKEIRFEIIK